jgi:hypothetical protein
MDLSMRMDKPLGDVWMPVLIEGSGRIAIASGPVSFIYRKEFINYRRTSVEVKYRHAPDPVIWDREDETKKH